MTAPGSKPNILIILTDDQEIETVTADVMPYLASEPEGNWVKLPNAVLSTPLCYPSRANMQTGQRSDHNLQKSNSGAPPPFNESNTIGAWMQGAGYRTGMVGKYLNAYPWTATGETRAGQAPQVPAGWDTWYATGTSTDYTGWSVVDNSGTLTTQSSYITDALSDSAAAFVTASDTRPFFLMWCPIAPHDPATPAPRHASLPFTLTDPLDFNEADVSDKPPWIQGNAIMQDTGISAQRQARIDTRRTLRSLDEGIQQVIGALKTAGKLGNTIIFFLTDNGVALGRKRIKNVESKKKNPYYWCFPALLRVRWPGVAPRTDLVLANSVDVIATCVDVAGATPGLALDGKSLSGRITKSDRRFRDVADFCYVNTNDAELPAWWAAFDGRYKLANYYNNLTQAPTFTELYDWATDPAELVNVAADPAYAEPLARLSGALTTLRADPHAFDNAAAAPDPAGLTVRGRTVSSIRRAGTPRTLAEIRNPIP